MDAAEVKRASHVQRTLRVCPFKISHYRWEQARTSSYEDMHFSANHQPGRRGDVKVSEYSPHRSQVDLAELYFLLLHFLAKGPCRQAAASLQQEALQHQLLPSRTDFRGEAPPRAAPNMSLNLGHAFQSVPL